MILQKYIFHTFPGNNLLQAQANKHCRRLQNSLSVRSEQPKGVLSRIL